MAKLPEPDRARLGRLAPELRALPAASLLWRVYRRGGAYPVRSDELRRYGPVATARFDPHREPPGFDRGRGVSYLAAEIRTALAEAFGATRVIDRRLGDPWLVGFATRRALALLDLTGAWPTRAGASMALASGRRDRARRCSRAIYETYPAVEGLLYPSSMHGNRPAVALYERAADAFPPHPALHRALVDPALLPDLQRSAAALGYGLR